MVPAQPQKDESMPKSQKNTVMPIVKKPSAKATKGKEIEKPAKGAKLAKPEVKVANVKKAGRSGSKQSTLIALLVRPAGATVEEMAKATGWQNHSVLGAISGVLRKRLGLTVA